MCFAQNQPNATAAPQTSAPVVTAPPASQNWQDQYAAPGWKDRLTKLSPAEETKFQAWALANKAPITDDYDMRGFYKEGLATSVNQNDGMPHFTDKYKTPLHESFSGESKYSRSDIAGPKWNSKDQLVAPDGRVLFDEPAVVAARKKGKH